ncbi:MAG TPA: hypothetical protein VIM73_07555, partial [Polyangiaceae bacterium]
ATLEPVRAGFRRLSVRSSAHVTDLHRKKEKADSGSSRRGRARRSRACDARARDSTLDSAVAAAIAPAPLWDAYEYNLKALDDGALGRGEAKLKVEFCGLTQRSSYHNRGCLEALAVLGRGDLAARDGLPFQGTDGVQVQMSVSGEEFRCTIREPRVFKATCSRGTCSASGVCTAQGAPVVEKFYAN